jgi:hypothetical protein
MCAPHDDAGQAQARASSAVKSPMQPSSMRPPLSMMRTSPATAFCMALGDVDAAEMGDG